MPLIRLELSNSMSVYIYRTVLDSINGVSSTRHTSLAAVSLPEGEIRQLQFVEDDTLMVLWSNASMYRPQSIIRTLLLTLRRRILLPPQLPLPARFSPTHI